MGGDDTAENMVYLTAEEHLLAHILLTKMYSYEGLLLALRHMLLPSSHSCVGRASFNKKYGYWRRKLAEHLKEMKWWNKDGVNQRAKNCPGIGWELGMAGDPWNKGLKTGPNPEHGKLMKGRAQPEKTETSRRNSGHRGTSWWTDGIKNKRSVIQPDVQWYLGTSFKSAGNAGMTWWNNGKVTKLSVECPVGFVKGRLKTR